MESRIKWIDATKGIAIILVIVGHLIGDNIVNRFILSFHMPIFFFVSGFLSSNNITCSFVEYIKKKTKSLLIPQLFLLVFTFLFDGCIGKTDWHIGFDVLFSAWFLWVLFYDEILWFFVSKNFVDKKIKSILFINIFFVLTIYCFDIHIGGNIEIIPMSFLFFLTGNYSKKNQQIFHDFSRKIKIKYWYPVICPIIFILARINPVPVYMYLNSYGNIMLFLTAAFLGIIMTVLFAKQICGKLNYINWIGRNSLIFYIFNFAAVDLIHVVQYKYLLVKFPGIMNSYFGKIAFYSASLIIILATLSIITITIRKFKKS